MLRSAPLLFLLCVLGTGCSEKTSEDKQVQAATTSEQPEPEPAEEPEPIQAKANEVVVVDGHTLYRYENQEQDEDANRHERITIVRSILDPEEPWLLNGKLDIGGAYDVSGDDATLVQQVDLSLSNPALANLFGCTQIERELDVETVVFNYANNSIRTGLMKFGLGDSQGRFTGQPTLVEEVVDLQASKQVLVVMEDQATDSGKDFVRRLGLKTGAAYLFNGGSGSELWAEYIKDIDPTKSRDDLKQELGCKY
ncbi:MAG: hypothetical protein DWQ01_09850 [Planctomycetota bacterium]|nr:MAG: hypothetical protein DWQ01_09850 [Planctomycetota bacterium]